TAVLAALAVLWAGSLVAARFLLWDSAKGAKLFEESNSNPMNDVAQHFGWLITRAKRSVAFFMDVLDRCTGSYVIEMLDTIQTLVRDSAKDPVAAKKALHAISFVIAADGAWIRRSYEI